MRSLDKFYKYLQNHEAEEPNEEVEGTEAADLKRRGSVPASPTRAESRYVIRNGVTVAVRRAEETEPSIPPATDVLSASASDDPSVDEAMISDAEKNLVADGMIWQSLPENVRRLAQLSADILPDAAPQAPERRQLIERLLNPLLSLEDTARLLGVCTATVRRYANKGALAHQRTIGQQRRFLLSDVLALLESRKPSAEISALPSEEIR